MDRPVLTEKLSVDLQIHICEFLRPCQILVLRQTCKAFHEATSQRIVWIHALSRICHENSLFLPTFPIHEMSVAELERAATAPRRWIALSFSKDRNKDGVLPSRPVRPLKDLRCYRLYIVPGGRYLVACGLDSLTVWDLGYVSDSDRFVQPAKIWATKVEHVNDFLAHPTPDGMGIRVLAYSEEALYIFEIYPGEEIVRAAKVAELILGFLDGADVTYILYRNRVVIYAPEKRIIIVWDFIANTTASWSASIPTDSYTISNLIFRATETTIMILRVPYFHHSMWIFQIPPLVPKTLFGTEDEFPEVAPILTFKYFDSTAIAGFPIPNSWYNSDLLPLYFDVIESSQPSDAGRYILNIASDLSNLSLTPTTADRVPMPTLEAMMYCNEKTYRICENSSVNICSKHGLNMTAYTLGFDLSSDSHDSTQTPTTWHVNTTPLANKCRRPFYGFCPASGRLVYKNDAGDTVICDFL